jgi:predicted protein tyrosine phosphatase
MLRRVIYTSQRRAEEMPGSASAAIVSITDPGKPVAALRSGSESVLRLAFDDVDEDTFPGANPELRAFDLGQAILIKEFTHRLPTAVATLVVHCRHGVSRSAGVARAIAQNRDLAFPADCRDFNRYVFRLLFQQLAGGD